MNGISLIYIVLWFLFSYSSYSQNFNQKIVIIIHGGAGALSRSSMASNVEKDYRKVLEQALDKGYEVLSNGGSSIDAVVEAVVILENSPLFNAGIGSVFNSEGSHELDTSIMEGKFMNAGAITGIQVVKNPILAAKNIMENSHHVFLMSKEAEEFSKMKNLEIVSPLYFDTKHRKDQWEKKKIRENKGYLYKESKAKFGTVGAITLDKEGNLAAATSTGGITNKRFGRVGDSPIIGSGTFANNKTCAFSCAGEG